MLCGVADVYDAMRSQRDYQQAFPTDRILAVLQRNDGKQFDQHLVRRFVQLVGIYPPATSSGSTRARSGRRAARLRAAIRIGRASASCSTPRPEVSERPYDVNLWQSPAGGRWPCAITAPVDPASVGLDPLALL